MRVAIYARYSSDMQREASIEDQVRLCRERIEREDWTLHQTYIDKAQSGGSLMRPGIQALMADGMAARFDIVVAEALDRISRDQEDIAGVFKRLTHAAVTIVTLAEGEIGHLHIGLKGTMNALFLKDLADKTRRGLRGRVEEGKSGGGNSYGYEVIHSLGGDGTLVRGDRRIKPSEAAVVKRIFRDYAAGKSPRTIAFTLNDEGVPCPSGSTWGPSTIYGNPQRGTGILNNELYVGRMVWNRLRYSKNPDTGKRISRLNPPSEWITRDVLDLRIIDDALWQKVKDRQASLAIRMERDQTDENRFWKAHRPKGLLSGLLKCGACGGSYSKISKDLYGCITARNKGTCGNRLNIRQDVLEAQILEGLGSKLLDPDLYKVFADEFYKELNRLRREASASVDSIRAELRQIEKKAAKLVNAITEGGPAKMLTAELQKLEVRQEALEHQLHEIDAPRAPIIHPALPELYRQKVAGLKEALASSDGNREAFELIRSLIEGIVLVPKDGRLRIELRGELAGILALCADAKKPQRVGVGADALAEQFKVVAGTGFEPVTFRL